MPRPSRQVSTPIGPRARTPRLPTGTVTFLFTDIEGSTALLQILGSRYRRLLEQHHEILRSALTKGHGVEISTEGDAFFAVFRSASDGVETAVAAQRTLQSARWPTREGVRVRMGLHTGEGRRGGDSYVGIDVHRAARIASAAHGGQVVISEATRAIIASSPPEGVFLRDLGIHRLKDLAQPEHLYDLVISGLDASFAPLRTLTAGQSMLPPQLTTFVGRQREISEVAARLQSDRLVTLTGPGGSGKTRLAVEVAARVVDRFPGGTFFVDLAPLTDPALVASAIAAALGLREDPVRPFVDGVVDRLRQREVLLVLDNFEQILPAADVVRRLLSETSSVRVLVTSRAPLRLYGEREYGVPSLGVPGHRPESSAESPNDDAVLLFLDRARSSRADFALTPSNAMAIAEICHRLDGLPLAIELAASQIRMMSPEALLGRLEQGLSIPAALVRSRPERQQTLDAAIGWSYRLLSDSQQRMLERLSVFAGHFGLHAVEVVTNPVGEPGWDALAELAPLVDGSLLRSIDAPDVEPRFLLLQTIRQFALERLVGRGNESEIRTRHARYFLALAEEAEPHLTLVDQAQWSSRLERDRANLRAALAWAIKERNAEIGLRLAAALWRFWQQGGQVAEGRAQLDELLAIPTVPLPLRARGLTAAGSLAYWQMDQPAAASAYKEALSIAREIGDREAEIEGLYNLSYAAILSGDYPEAGRLLLESRELAEQGGDAYRAALADGAIAWQNLWRGDYTAVIERGDQVLAALRESGNVLALGSAAAALGLASRLTGDTVAAGRHYLEALGLLQVYADLPITARLLLLVSATLEAGSQHAEALRLWSAAEAIYAEIEAPPPPPASLKAEGVVDRARSAVGDAAAEQALQEGHQLSPEAAVALAMQLLQL